MNDGNVMDGLSSVAIGGYLIAVAYQGNVKQLGHQLYGEEGYLEFLFALFCIGAINKWGPGGKVSVALTVGALVLFAYRIDAKNNLAAATKDFSEGKAGLFATIKKFAGSFS